MRRRAQGFTLLEVMVALAILAGALVGLIEANTRNVAAANHSKLMTTATLLARAEMVRLEDDLDERGFPDLDDVRGGNFSDDGFANFRWEARIEKIELPGNLADQAQKAAQGPDVQAQADKAGASLGGFNPTTAGIGGAAGVVMSQFEMIRNAIEQSIRKVTLRVYWQEGRLERFLEVTTFQTDASKVDFALPGLGALGGAGLPGLGGPGGPGAAGGAGGTGGGAAGTSGGGPLGGGPKPPGTR
jgi:general secretion pathway protein I